MAFQHGVRRWWRLASFAVMATAQISVAHAEDNLGDPAGSSVIVSAVRWLQGTLLGVLSV